MLESLRDAGLKTCNFIKETPTQVFSCEYCEIFKAAIFKIFPVNIAKFLRTASFKEHLW